MYKILKKDIKGNDWQFMTMDFDRLSEAMDEVNNLINSSCYHKNQLTVVQIYDYNLRVDIQFN